MTTSIPLHMLKKWDLLHTSGGTPFCNVRKLLYQITLPASTAPATIFRPRQPSFPSVLFRSAVRLCLVPFPWRRPLCPRRPCATYRPARISLWRFSKSPQPRLFHRPALLRQRPKKEGRGEGALHLRLGSASHAALLCQRRCLSNFPFFYSLNVMPFSMLSTMHRL